MINGIPFIAALLKWLSFESVMSLKPHKFVNFIVATIINEKGAVLLCYWILLQADSFLCSSL